MWLSIASDEIQQMHASCMHIQICMRNAHTNLKDNILGYSLCLSLLCSMLDTHNTGNNVLPLDKFRFFRNTIVQVPWQLVCVDSAWSTLVTFYVMQNMMVQL
jgi:hypothetical protein